MKTNKTRKEMARECSKVKGVVRKLAASLNNMLDLWTRHCAPRVVDHDSQVKEARAALKAADVKPPKPYCPRYQGLAGEGKLKLGVEVWYKNFKIVPSWTRSEGWTAYVTTIGHSGFKAYGENKASAVSKAKKQIDKIAVRDGYGNAEIGTRKNKPTHIREILHRGIKINLYEYTTHVRVRGSSCGITRTDGWMAQCVLPDGNVGEGRGYSDDEAIESIRNQIDEQLDEHGNLHKVYQPVGLSVSDICGKGSPNSNEIYTYKDYEIKLTQTPAYFKRDGRLSAGWKTTTVKLSTRDTKELSVCHTKWEAKRLAEEWVDKRVIVENPTVYVVARKERGETQEVYRGRIILLRESKASCATTWQLGRDRYQQATGWSGWRTYTTAYGAKRAAMDGIDNDLGPCTAGIVSDIQPEVIEETV